MIKHAKRIIFLIIFLTVFLILGILYTNIGFDSDCFGLVFFSSQIKSLHDLFFHLFKPIQSSYVALNELANHQQEGFLTYFRPLMTLSHYLCYQFFGFKPYVYHLINVGLHALTAGLVFTIFSNFINLLAAFFLALFFAFHPALTPAYVGVTSHVVPTYVFAALIVLAYIKFLKTNYQWWYALSALLFLLSLLCYEIIIIFPLVLVLFLVMFSYQKIFNRSYLFFVTTGLYLITRFFLLGSPAAHEQKILNLWHLPGKILFNWHQAIKPFWGLQSLPKSEKFAVVTVMLSFSYFFFMIFFQAPERRKRLIFYTISFFLLAWPVSLINSDARYFYPAIPFFALILYEMISHIVILAEKSKQDTIFKKFLNLKEGFVLPFLLLHFIGWGIFHDTQALKTRSFVTHQRDKAFLGLVDYYGHIPDLRLIMLGTLHSYNNDTLIMQQGMTQAARLFFKNPELEAYHVTQAKIYSHKQTQRSFLITRLPNGFRFASPDPENLFFMIPHSWPEEMPVPFSMGTIIVHKKAASWKASDISFLFDNTWLNQTDLVRTKFVTFDVKLWSFVELKLEGQ